MTGENGRTLSLRRRKQVTDVGLTTPTEVVELSGDDVDAVTVALRQALPAAGADGATLRRILAFLEKGNDEGTENG